MKQNIAYTFAFMLLRFWLAARAIGTGLTKFIVKVGGVEGVKNPEYEKAITKAMEENALTRAEVLEKAQEFSLPPETITDTVQFFNWTHYHGLPEAGPMTEKTFTASPLMPSFAVAPYSMVLGYALIILGLTTLLGVCTRISLFLMGLLYISLTYGFIILEPTMGPSAAAGIAYLGVHMVLIVGALMLADYNKFELLSCKKFCGICCCKDK